MAALIQSYQVSAAPDFFLAKSPKTGYTTCMKTSHLSSKPTAWSQIVSILVLPVIGLYMLAYRLQGVPHTYRLGNFDVTPLKPVTRKQFLFSRLFPAAVLLPILGLAAALTHLLIS